MNGWIAAIGSAAAVLLLQSAQAATYTPSKGEACRAEPHADALVLRQLHAGEAVTILAERDGWRQVQAGPSTCWVERGTQPIFGHTALSGRTVVPAHRPAAARHLTLTQHHHVALHRAASHASRHRSSSSYSGGGCSCGGRHVCVGPRGGRYCITSGGNKRYGV